MILGDIAKVSSCHSCFAQLVVGATTDRCRQKSCRRHPYFIARREEDTPRALTQTPLSLRRMISSTVTTQIQHPFSYVNRVWLGFDSIIPELFRHYRTNPSLAIWFNRQDLTGSAG